MNGNQNVNAEYAPLHDILCNPSISDGDDFVLELY
jgi:hypothetical protein